MLGMLRNRQYEENFNAHCDDIESQNPLLSSQQKAVQENSDNHQSFRSIDIIRFRPLKPYDRDEIKSLHEEWFPVTYKDEFYDDLVLQRMFNSGEDLYTLAAIVTENHHSSKGGTIGEDDYSAGNFSAYNKKDSGGKIHGIVGEEIRHEKNDRIVGCIVGSYVDVSRVSASTVELLINDTSRYSRMFYIMTLGTISAYRHQNIATNLVNQVIREVEEDPNCGAIYLHVITFNYAAIRFYEKYGFYRVTEIKDYYLIDDKNYNCYLYAKYYHGNHGQRDYYYLFTSFVSSIWNRVVTNTLFGQNSTNRARTIDNMKLK